MKPKLHQILEQTWGYNQFRPLQPEIIQSILNGRDTIGLLPTGGGKSLCFQLPALAQTGYTIVVSPLIALIKDQVEALQKLGVEAEGINYQMDPELIKSVYRRCVSGSIRLLYISPERTGTQGLRELLVQRPPDMLVVDEAHCISQWGHDFRPAYLKIAAVKSILPDLPIHAFTATADKRVLNDIRQSLELRSPAIFRKSYRRENLAFRVSYSENKQRTLRHFIGQHPGSGIIYARSRRRTETVSEYLRRFGINALAYHAGLKADDRSMRQNRWMASRDLVIVSTNAFGMGVDKADVRYVIHLDLPEDLESYYQEAGRAGRDGLPSIALVLYHNGDLHQLEERWNLAYPGKKVLHAFMRFIRRQARSTADPIVALHPDQADRLAAKGMEWKQAGKYLEVLKNYGMIDFDDDPSRLVSMVRPLTDPENPHLPDVTGTEADVLRALFYLYDFRRHPTVALDESMLAGYLDFPEETILHTLRSMKRAGIIEYDEKIERIFVRLIDEEENKNNLQSYFRHRRVKERKMRHMLDFIQLPMCRQLYILRYFGEDADRNCKKCDLCLSRQQVNYHRRELQGLREILKQQCPEGGLDIDVLMWQLPFFEQKKYAAMLQELYLDGEVGVIGKKIWLRQ